MAVYKSVSYTHLAVTAVRFVKGVFEVKIRAVFGLHDRVINPGAGDGNPAHQVAVFGVHISVFLKRSYFFRGRGVFQLQRGQLHILLYQLRHFFKGFGALLLVEIFTGQHSPGEKMCIRDR